MWIYNYLSSWQEIEIPFSLCTACLSKCTPTHQSPQAHLCTPGFMQRVRSNTLELHEEKKKWQHHIRVSISWDGNLGNLWCRPSEFHYGSCFLWDISFSIDVYPAVAPNWLKNNSLFLSFLSHSSLYSISAAQFIM